MKSLFWQFEYFFFTFLDVNIFRVVFSSDSELNMSGLQTKQDN